MDVLYIEDNRINQIIVEKGLTPHGYRVTVATTPAEGIQLALENTYDIILVDLNLNNPDIDGFGVFQKIRHRKKPSGTVFIAHTSYTGREIYDQCHNAGFDHFMPKPFKVDEFKQTISPQ